MTEALQPTPKTRLVNIDSAVGLSSHHLPVFVALSVEGGEAQVVQTFATARDVFGHVFSVMLDRQLQRRAVEKVEKLVPASAHLKDSTNTEYVLFVRGKAIFWFSSAAAKGAAGRRLLLEHARAGRRRAGSFYVLNTRARRIRLAVVAFGLVTLPLIVALVWHLPVNRILPFHRRDTPDAAPPLNASGNSGDRPFESGASPEAQPKIARQRVVDIDVGAGATPADEPFPDPVFTPAVMARRQPATPAWPSRMTRAPQAVRVSSGSAPNVPFPANSEHARQNLGTAPDRRDGGAGDPTPEIKGAAAVSTKSLDRKANNAPMAPVVLRPAPPNRPE